jgi:hypothetical protein
LLKTTQHTRAQVPFFTNATQWGELPTGGLNGKGDGVGPRRTPSECRQVCGAIYNVRCFWKNKCWGRVGGFFGLIGGLLGGGESWVLLSDGDGVSQKGRFAVASSCYIFKNRIDVPTAPQTPHAAALLILLAKLGLLVPMLSFMFGWIPCLGRGVRGRGGRGGRGRGSMIDDDGEAGDRRGVQRYRPSGIEDSNAGDGGGYWGSGAGGASQPGGWPWQAAAPYTQPAGPQFYSAAGGMPAPPYLQQQPPQQQPRISTLIKPPGGRGSVFAGFGGPAASDSGGDQRQQRESAAGGSRGRYSHVHGSSSGGGGGGLSPPPAAELIGPELLAGGGGWPSGGGARGSRYEPSPHGSTEGLLGPSQPARASSGAGGGDGRPSRGQRQRQSPQALQQQLYENPAFDKQGGEGRGIGRGSSRARAGSGGGGSGSSGGEERRSRRGGGEDREYAGGASGSSRAHMTTLRRRSSSSGNAAGGGEGGSRGSSPRHPPSQPPPAERRERASQQLQPLPPRTLPPLQQQPFDRAGPAFRSAPGGGSGGDGGRSSAAGLEGSPRSSRHSSRAGSPVPGGARRQQPPQPSGLGNSSARS